MPYKIYFGLVAFCVSVLAVPAPHSLPACSWTPQPCSCPSGTNFVNSTTWAVIDANARDVSAITDNFLHTAWFGSVPIATTGDPKRPGATRSLTQGNDVFVEELFSFDKNLDGSFIMKYQQADPVPITYTDTNPSTTFAGEWDTLQVTSIGLQKTAVTWNIWSCFSTTISFAQFHESALDNVTAILRSQGELHGPGIAPYSATS